MTTTSRTAMPSSRWSPSLLILVLLAQALPTQSFSPLSLPFVSSRTTMRPVQATCIDDETPLSSLLSAVSGVSTTSSPKPHQPSWMEPLMENASQGLLLMGSTVAMMTMTTMMMTVDPVSAASASSPPPPPNTTYISGRAPKIPGEKPRDKSDTKGTKKDPNFLRSVADCKSTCEQAAGPGFGPAKSKEDCLSECQDICCTTYEQCTFAIVPR